MFVLARKPLVGTVVENVLTWGTGALNIDVCRVAINPEVDDPRLGGRGSWYPVSGVRWSGNWHGTTVNSSDLGRWPPNVLLETSPEILAEFPHTASGQPSGLRNNDGGYHGDEGSAARFFPQFTTLEETMFFDDETPETTPTETTVKLNGFLYAGDNLEYLRTLPDNSIDAIVTDPPYGLGKEPDPRKVLTAWLNDEAYQPSGRGFMGKEWDAFVPSPVLWQECLRVLKPGGHMIAFAGTRTYDWVVMGVRMAGFEIRDSIAWLYGCLKPSTKALTPEGPKGYQELSPGDLVVCWDPDTREYRNLPIQEVLEYDYDGELRCWEVNGSVFSYTPNHRVLVGDEFVEAEKVSGDYFCRVYREESVNATFAGVEKYQGKVWCLRVPTGAFVASENGVAIPTGNSGFPKSLNVGKNIRNKYSIEMDSSAINASTVSDILNIWKTYLNLAGIASNLSLKETIEAGTSTQNNSFAAENAAQIFLLKKSKSPVVIAVPLSQDPLPTCKNTSIVQENVGEKQPALKNLVVCVELWCENQCLSQITMDFSADRNVWESQRGKIKDKHKAEEALRIWLGNRKSSNKGDTDALCAALTESLRLTILSQSETFQNVDMMSQMDYVSATHVITTEFMAECLISYMVDTLRKSHPQNQSGESPEAQQWEGWGTALKPAMEPAVLARKPLAGTVVENVLTHGTGGLNIEAARVEGKPRTTHKDGNCYPHTGMFNWTGAKAKLGGSMDCLYSESFNDVETTVPEGRWPANVVHDGSDVVVSEFPETQSGKVASDKGGYLSKGETVFLQGVSTAQNQHGDSGSAARFFTQATPDPLDGPLFKYCAKSSTSERNMGTEAIQEAMEGKGNIHSTVKPLNLMEFLIKLITPPGGVVLDPFLGSGTTAMAAELLGFRWIGCERETDYAMIAYHRIAHVIENRDSILERQSKEKTVAGPKKQKVEAKDTAAADSILSDKEGEDEGFFF